MYKYHHYWTNSGDETALNHTHTHTLLFVGDGGNMSKDQPFLSSNILNDLSFNK